MGTVLQFRPLSDQPAITQRRVRRSIDARRGASDPFALLTLWTDLYFMCLGLNS